MYQGEVSVPQTELLSLIAAAKSLGIKGLAEDSISDGDEGSDQEGAEKNSKAAMDVRGVKRESDMNESQMSFTKKAKKVIPKPEQKISPKPWSNKCYKSFEQLKENEPVKDMVVPKANNENVQFKNDDMNHSDRNKIAKEPFQKSKDKDKAAQEKGCVNFFEVNVKQEEEDSAPEEPNLTESPGKSDLKYSLCYLYFEPVRFHI